MPFPTVPSIPPSPTATVYLHGLLLLSRNASGGCDIGIHRSAPPHVLRIDIVMNVPFPIPLRPLTGPLQGRDFQIEVQNTTGQGVRKYERPDGFNRAPSDDLNDFRWAVDLGGPLFHNVALGSLPADTRPGVVIDEGVLYSARLSDPDVSVWRNGGGKTPEDLHRITSFIGVNLYDDILLTWHNPGGRDEALSLPKLPLAFKYSITVLNDPPRAYHNPHDELWEYYKVLLKQGNPIPANDQFQLEVTTNLAPFGDFEKISLMGSDRIPCMPVVIDG